MMVEKIKDDLINGMFRYLRDKQTWKLILSECREQLIKLDEFERLPSDDSIARVFDTKEFKEIERTISTDREEKFSTAITEPLLKLFVSSGYEEPLAKHYCALLQATLFKKLRGCFPQLYELGIIDEIKESVDEITVNISTIAEKVENTASTVITLLNEDTIKKNAFAIQDMDRELQSITFPQIDLSFFDFQDEDFSQKLNESISSGERNIYIKGYSKEETLYCVLFELGKIEALRNRVLVIKNKAVWDVLQNRTEDCVYIPYFYCDEIKPILNNITIFIYNCEQSVRKTNIIELNNRLASNLKKKLQDAFEKADQEYASASSLMHRTNGKYTALKRELFQSQFSNPSWIEKEVETTSLLKAMLLGCWCISDVNVIQEFLTPIPYDNFIINLLPVMSGEDPYIIRQEKSIYHEEGFRITCLDEAWECQKSLLYPKLLDDFEKLCTNVLTFDPDSDGSIYSYEQSIAHQLSGKRPKCSYQLRQSLCNSLLFLNEYIADNWSAPERIVRIAESIMNSITGFHGWCFFSTYAVLLVEAAPEIILSRYEREISFGSSSPFIQLFEKKSFIGWNEQINYIYILSSLELLISSKKYAYRAIACLCKLNDLDLTLLTGNSPNSSLRYVFCAWYHDSALDVNQIKMEASKIVHAYKKGWEIISNELPENSPSCIFGAPHKPKSIHLRKKVEIKPSEQFELYKHYVDICVAGAGTDISRWVKLLEKQEIFRYDTESIIDKLHTIIPTLSDNHRKIIQNKLREILNHNRKFKNAVWALPESILEPISILYRSIQFSDPIYEFSHLFGGYLGNSILDINPPVWDEHDNNDFRTNIEKERELILAEMTRFRDSKYELEHFVDIADFSGDIRLFGNIISEVFSPNGFDETLFLLLLKLKTEKQLYYSYVEETYSKQKKDANTILFALKIAREQNLSSENIITLAQIDYHVFDSHDIHAYLSAPEISTFWGTLPYHWAYRVERSEIKHLIDKSLEFSNGQLFCASLEQIQQELPPDECLEYLELAANHGIKAEEFNASTIEKVFEKLYTQLQLSQYKERIAQLEFHFLQLGAFKAGTCYHSLIKEDPGLYAFCINILYKHEGGPEPDRMGINMDTVYNVFDSIKFCPGESNGEIDEVTLRNWVHQFKKLLDGQHQTPLFHPFLGRLLAHSPVGDDGFEPHEAVRRLIEDIYHEELINSFYIERLNMRGIYNVSAGKGEKILALKFKANAEALVQNFPNTAKIYTILAEQYDKAAKEARRQAEYVDGY